MQQGRRSHLAEIHGGFFSRAVHYKGFWNVLRGVYHMTRLFGHGQIFSCNMGLRGYIKVKDADYSGGINNRALAEMQIHQ